MATFALGFMSSHEPFGTKILRIYACSLSSFAFFREYSVSIIVFFVSNRIHFTLIIFFFLYWFASCSEAFDNFHASTVKTESLIEAQRNDGVVRIYKLRAPNDLRWLSYFVSVCNLIILLPFMITALSRYLCFVFLLRGFSYLSCLIFIFLFCSFL